MTPTLLKIPILISSLLSFDLKFLALDTSPTPLPPSQTSLEFEIPSLAGIGKLFWNCSKYYNSPVGLGAGDWGSCESKGTEAREGRVVCAHPWAVSLNLLTLTTSLLVQLNPKFEPLANQGRHFKKRYISHAGCFKSDVEAGDGT